MVLKPYYIIQERKVSKLKWKRTSRMDFFKAVNPFTNIAFQLLERRKKGQKKVRVF